MHHSNPIFGRRGGGYPILSLCASGDPLAGSCAGCQKTRNTSLESVATIRQPAGGRWMLSLATHETKVYINASLHFCNGQLGWELEAFAERPSRSVTLGARVRGHRTVGAGSPRRQPQSFATRVTTLSGLGKDICCIKSDSKIFFGEMCSIS